MLKKLYFLLQHGAVSTFLLLSFYLPAIALAAGSDPLEQFTGTHTRVVWIQEQGAGADSFAFGRNFKLMGYDSRDGKKERPLLDEVANFFKPILTPDGKRVVVSDRLKHRVYVLDFDRGRKKDLGRGVAVDVWDDPATGTTWVYALSGDGPENKYFTTHPLVRFPLDKPDRREPVWNKTHLSWSNFDLSRNGKFAGGLFPWPHAGILLFEENSWRQLGKGCWTALSPDNSAVLWVFDGLHRNLNFVNPFTNTFWTTNINNAPGINGFEVYHPRWSNHVRYLTVTGPYVEGEGGNKITGGGTRVELYVGRFSPDLKKVEAWVQVTHNKKADFYPDVWLANGPESSLTSAEEKQTLPLAAPGNELGWPAGRDRLVFVWQNVLAENKLPENSLVGFQQFRVVPGKRARFNRFLEMSFHSGGFTVDWPGARVLNTAALKGVLGVELLYTPDSVSDRSSGPIVRLRDKKGRDIFRMVQQGKGVEIVLAGKSGRGMTMKVADVLTAHRPELFFIAIGRDRMKLFGNGSLLADIPLPENFLIKRPEIDLVFGSPEPGVNGLDSALSHVAFFAGGETDQEVVRDAQLVTGALEARREIPELRLQAELVEASKVPAPEDLGAYSRALVVNRYRIDKVEEGKYTEKEILVAQWAVLDRTILPETKDFTPGRRAELRVEPFDQHPELEGERLMMDMFDPDLELYYQVSP